MVISALGIVPNLVEPRLEELKSREKFESVMINQPTYEKVPVLLFYTTTIAHN